MNRDAILKKAVETLAKLPDSRLEEISRYAEFLLKSIDDDILVKGISRLNAKSTSFDYLLDEEDLYTVCQNLSAY